MYPPCSKPTEAATAPRCGALLVQSRPGTSRARARTWGRGTAVGYTMPSAARRRLVVASLGVRESLPAQSPGEEEAMTVEVEEGAGDSPEILPSPDPDVSTNTVRVKFVLEKECAFGQQFFVVGDDPALGLWNPAKATALDWSEGHVWTVKTDLPANKRIEFKFLLRDATGHVQWQHGGNRTLQTTDTPNTLVVHEDWDHGKNQRVSEEEEISIVAEEDATFSDDGSTGAMLADELQPGENLQSNKSAVADAPLQMEKSAVADAPLQMEMKEANEENQPQFILEEDQRILNELSLHREADAASENGYDHPSDDDNGIPNEDDAAMCQEYAQIAGTDSTSTFKNDLDWARKALQQLLRFLGFQIGTSRT